MVKRWVAQAMFWPTFGWNLALGRVLKVRHWWDQVDPALILGARPLRRDVPVLANDWNVTGVVNMCEEFAGPVDLYKEFGVEQLWLPTTDFNHPSLESVESGVEFVEKHARQGGATYVHCKAGRARSATIAICWLVKYRAMSVDQAQQFLLEHRPHVNSKLPERPVVQEFCSKLASLKK